VTGRLNWLDRSPLALNNGSVVIVAPSMLSQSQVLIALVVAAHAGVLAVRLGFSLYKA
jgi:photosystem I subunit 12